MSFNPGEFAIVEFAIPPEIDTFRSKPAAAPLKPGPKSLSIDHLERSWRSGTF
jgi:hypothetical protein